MIWPVANEKYVWFFYKDLQVARYIFFWNMPRFLVRNGKICIAGKAKTDHLSFTCMEGLNFANFKYVYLFSEFMICFSSVRCHVFSVKWLKNTSIMWSEIKNVVNITRTVIGRFPWSTRVQTHGNLVPRIFSFSNMASAGKKSLGHGNLKRSLTGS